MGTGGVKKIPDDPLVYTSFEKPTALIAVMDTPKTTKEMSALMAKAKLGIGGMVGECDQSRCNGCGVFGSGPYQDSLDPLLV